MLLYLVQKLLLLLLVALGQIRSSLIPQTVFPLSELSIRRMSHAQFLEPDLRPDIALAPVANPLLLMQ